MTKVEKSGMLMNADKEIVGWFNAGDEVDMQEGDVLISHPKTAEKHGVAEQFKELKDANKPAKAAKEEAGEGEAKTRGPRGPRLEVPKTGTYTVMKPKAAELKDGEASNVRHTILVSLFNNTSFEDFWAAAPDKFDHPARDGEIKSFATSGLVAYAIKRGMISVDK